MCKAAKTAVDNEDLVSQSRKFISIMGKISTLFQPYLSNEVDEGDLPDFGESLEPLVGGLAGAAATFAIVSSSDLPTSSDLPESLKNDFAQALKPLEEVVDRIGVGPLNEFAAWLDSLWTDDAGDGNVGVPDGMDEFLNLVLIAGMAVSACHF